LLRIHVFGFFAGESEKGVVEGLNVGQDTGGEGARPSRGGAPGMEEGGGIKAVVGNMTDRITAVF